MVNSSYFLVAHLFNFLCNVFAFFIFVLCYVSLVLPVSLDFPILIAPSVFSNVYLLFRRFLLTMNLDIQIDMLKTSFYQCFVVTSITWLTVTEYLYLKWPQTCSTVTEYMYQKWPQTCSSNVVVITSCPFLIHYLRLNVSQEYHNGRHWWSRNSLHFWRSWVQPRFLWSTCCFLCSVL